MLLELGVWLARIDRRQKHARTHSSVQQQILASSKQHAGKPYTGKVDASADGSLPPCNAIQAQPSVSVSAPLEPCKHRERVQFPPGRGHFLVLVGTAQPVTKDWDRIRNSGWKIGKDFSISRTTCGGTCTQFALLTRERSSAKQKKKKHIYSKSIGYLNMK